MSYSGNQLAHGSQLGRLNQLGLGLLEFPVLPLQFLNVEEAGVADGNRLSHLLKHLFVSGGEVLRLPGREGDQPMRKGNIEQTARIDVDR